ncbi:hypothetical protein A2U01_0081489, partial [Trifolium medium]|nr:hypothetical protein [Trifolium medium]
MQRSEEDGLEANKNCKGFLEDCKQGPDWEDLLKNILDIRS